MSTRETREMLLEGTGFSAPLILPDVRPLRDAMKCDYLGSILFGWKGQHQAPPASRRSGKIYRSRGAGKIIRVADFALRRGQRNFLILFGRDIWMSFSHLSHRTPLE